MAHIVKGLDEIIYVRGIGEKHDISVALSPSPENFVCHIQKGDEQISVNGRYIRIEHWGISLSFSKEGVINIYSVGLKDVIRLIHRNAFIDNGKPEYSWWEYIWDSEVRIISGTLIL